MTAATKNYKNCSSCIILAPRKHRTRTSTYLEKRIALDLLAGHHDPETLGDGGEPLDLPVRACGFLELAGLKPHVLRFSLGAPLAEIIVPAVRGDGARRRAGGGGCKMK